jgi:inhibitor of the pro-sigma K processing machinery
MNSTIFIVVIIISSMFIIGCVIKQRPDLILDFLLRVCFTTAGIYVLNLVMGIQGYSLTVGINAVTVLSGGLLGLPGFLLMYGLSLYYSMG